MTTLTVGALSAGQACCHSVCECPVCGETRVPPSFTFKHLPVCRCSRCGLLFLSVQPNGEAPAGVAAEEYSADGKVEPGRASTAAIRAAGLSVERLVEYMGDARGRLLEIGCGSGHFLEAARSAGFEIHGRDVSPHLCRAANQRLGGEFVVCGDPEDFELSDDLYDVCAVADVIERVRNPVRLLERIGTSLRPGGVLLLRTSGLDGWSTRIGKQRLPGANAKHFCSFDRETIQNVLAKCGYRAIEVSCRQDVVGRDPIAQRLQRVCAVTMSGVQATFRRLALSSASRRVERQSARGMTVLARLSPPRPRALLSVIVPVYNEKQTFSLMMERLLAKRIEGVDREILLIESHSTDGTAEDVEKFRGIPDVKIIREDHPRGKGHAVRVGFEQANGDFILIQDADLEYDVNDYDKLLEPLRTFSRAFVLGSRHMGGWTIRHYSSQPLLSAVVNFAHCVFRVLLNLVCGTSVRDPFTMYKVFRRDCLHGLTFSADRFDFDWELYIKLTRKGYVPLELPISYKSRSFKEGKKVRFFRDPLTWLWALVRFGCAPLYRRRRAKVATR